MKSLPSPPDLSQEVFLAGPQGCHVALPGLPLPWAGSPLGGATGKRRATGGTAGPGRASLARRVLHIIGLLVKAFALMLLASQIAFTMASASATKSPFAWKSNKAGNVFYPTYQVSRRF